MFDPNDEWDCWRTRYSGYTPETLEGFVQRGEASYDATTDTYTVFAGSRDGHSWDEFTVTDTFQPS